MSRFVTGGASDVEGQSSLLRLVRDSRSPASSRSTLSSRPDSCASTASRLALGARCRAGLDAQEVPHVRALLPCHGARATRPLEGPRRPALRSSPSLVHCENLTRATRSGRTHWASAPCRSGVVAKGQRPRVQRFHQRQEAVQVRLVEAAAHTPGELQLPPVVEADKDGPQGAGPRPLAGRVARHDEVLRLHGLDLEPGRAAGRGLVVAVLALGQHPLQPQCRRRLEERLAAALHVLHRPHGLPRHQRLPQQALTLHQRRLAKGDPGQVEQVEGIVDQRRLWPHRPQAAVSSQRLLQ